MNLMNLIILINLFSLLLLLSDLNIREANHALKAEGVGD